ncbi:DUF4998 domain-containing protein [Limibacterium fermenti]|jgi:hypothetical protein|uniref:DUF4998 domain-containing protein n=1 Tax=Limibacterium fermenti TaxID=3229863 RepID=UPI003A7279C3
MKDIVKILSLIYLLVFVSSCLGEIDPLDYIEGDEIRYAGKANDVLYRAGQNRLEIQFTLGPDPNISGAAIYWNLNRDSIIFDIDRSSLENNRVNKVIENLTENIYNFEIYTIDKFGNRSVPVNITGRTYGDRYATVMADREIEGFELINKEGDVKVLFADSIITSRGVYLEYKDIDNETKKMFVDNTALYGIIPGASKLGVQPLKIKTFFLPEPLAIDTFFSVNTITYDPDDLSPLVDIVSKPYSYIELKGDATAQGWNLLWDGRIMSGKEKYDDVGWNSFNTNIDGNDPQWVTIDVGAPIKIERIRADFYYYRSGTMPKNMDIMAYKGEGVPPSLEIIDADYWKDWQVINTFDTSSTADYPNNDEGFNKGLDKTFEYNSVPIARYYRLRNNQAGYYADWAKSRFSLSELTFWEYVGY